MTRKRIALVGIAAALALLVGRFGARASVEEGKPVEVAVDTRSLHFFDAETSQGIYDGETSQKGASA